VSASDLQAIVAAGREHAYKAIGQNVQAVLRLDPLALLTILDMLEGSHGYTMLVRDDAIHRLNAAIDRAEQHAISLGIGAVRK
jgi:hypothetical protein